MEKCRRLSVILLDGHHFKRKETGRVLESLAVTRRDLSRTESVRPARSQRGQTESEDLGRRTQRLEAAAERNDGRGRKVSRCERTEALKEAADGLKEKMSKMCARPISTSAPLSRSRLGTCTAGRLKWPDYPAGGPPTWTKLFQSLLAR